MIGGAAPGSRSRVGAATPASVPGEFAIVTARFNQRVTARLAEGARRALLDSGVASARIAMLEVPGAWELPPVVAALLDTHRYRGIVACGAVIRGETAHFDFVARGCIDALARLQLEARIPVALAVLTTETLGQALARAGGEAGNKGEEAALAALETADVIAALAD